MSRFRSVLISGLVLSGWIVSTPRLIIAADAASRESALQQYDFDEYSRQPISFYYCQAGFPPDGDKPIYVWTRKEFAHGTAVLRNCATGKTTSIPLVSQGINLWGRQDWIADCTSAGAEGDYTLRVEFGGQSAETAPFAISKSCYEELREKAAKHYFLKRCGIFCHTHDANLYSLEPDSFGRVLSHVPASGGWHDAHDDNKWVFLLWMSFYGLLKTEEQFSPHWQASNEPYPYCLAEAWWGIDWLLRMQKPDGTFYYGVFEWFPEKQGDHTILKVHHAEQNYDDLHRDHRAVLDVWGDNAICKLLGRQLNSSPSTAPKYFAYSAHVLRYCGRLMRPYDHKKAERCALAAKKTVEYLERLDKYPSYQELEVHAGLALYWLEEAKDGGGQAALTKAERYLARMLPLQQPEGHFHSSKTCRGLEFCPEEDIGDESLYATEGFPFGYTLAFVEYLDYARQEKNKTFALVDDVKASYLRFARMLARFCNATVFRQPTEIRFNSPPAVIIPVRKTLSGYNPYIIAAGVVFASAERLAGFSDGQKLAQRQLQWVFGANPRFMSSMNQLGVRNVGQYAASSSVTRQYYPMAFYRHLRDMRWGVTLGIYGPEDAQPANYPNAGKSMVGTYVHEAQETWLGCNGWLLMLLAQLK